MKPIIIIGAGLAGYSVAREFRKLDKTTPLLILTADDGAVYSKPMLSNAFAQGKDATQLVTQNAHQIAAQLSVHIITQVRAVGIDTVRKAVNTASGAYDYDRLVLAMGAQPIRLTLGGNAADQVLSVNHIHDYAVFREKIAALQSARKARIAILGAGLIGCEFADDLAGAGHPVTVIDPNPLPLSAIAAPPLSEGLHAALTARGIALRLGTTAARIDHHATDGLRVTLADGSTLEADIVLSAVGLRPDTTLAQSSGLTCGRGIVVDQAGRTSKPDIYALGDCAEYTLQSIENILHTRTMPYIAPLLAAARAIARNLQGDSTQIDTKPAPVIVKTPSYPLALFAPAMHLGGSGTWSAEEEDGRMVCRFHDAQKVLRGFGVAHHESGVRQRLLAALVS